MINAGSHNDSIVEYRRYMAQARKWAQYARMNRAERLPWVECAKLARENFNWAKKLIG